MRPNPRPPVTTGLDISFLGIIVAAVGFYAGLFADTTAETPDLVRFREASADASTPAAMPRDNALLLLARSGSDTAGSGAGGFSLEALGGVGGLPSLLVLVGLAMIVAGPIWAWLQL